MEMKQLLIRLRPEVAEALEVLKDRTRMSKSVMAENAIRDYLARHEISVQQPQAD